MKYIESYLTTLGFIVDTCEYDDLKSVLNELRNKYYN